MAATPEERLNLYLAAVSSVPPTHGPDDAEPSPPEMSVCDYLCLLYRGDMPPMLDCCQELRFWNRWSMRQMTRLGRAIRRRRRSVPGGDPNSNPAEVFPMGTPRPGSRYTDDQIQEYEARELDILYCFTEIRDENGSGADDRYHYPGQMTRPPWLTDEEWENAQQEDERRRRNCCLAAKAVRDCIKSRCYQVCNYNFDTCSGDCLNIHPPVNQPVTTPYYDRI